MKPKPHTAGILSALVTIAGLASSPEFFNLLPGRWGLGVAVGGMILQAATKPVHAGDTVVVDRDVAEVKGLAKPKEIR